MVDATGMVEADVGSSVVETEHLEEAEQEHRAQEGGRDADSDPSEITFRGMNLMDIEMMGEWVQDQAQ